MRVFKTKAFARIARKEALGDKALTEAVADIERGLIDADLGGGLIKQRIARTGEGKRGGFRTLIACHFGKRAIFLFGVPDSDGTPRSRAADGCQKARRPAGGPEMPRLLCCRISQTHY